MDREALERNQISVYFAAIAIAATVGLIVPESSKSLGVLVTPSIAILMYAMFLQIPFLELKASFSDKRFMAALLAANFIAIPLLVWVLTRGLADYPALLAGALLVLLTPCIDYVVVFTYIGKGDSKLTLAATPLLLVIQLALLPLYLSVMLAGETATTLAAGPFFEAFFLLIALPMALAVLTTAGGNRWRSIATWNNAWAWMPVPAMAIVLILVIASQLSTVIRDFNNLLPVIPIYIAFMLIAPVVGALTAKLFKLPGPTARSVVFSSATRNSLVVLPLALALPEEIRGLAAAAVLTQTLIELVSEIFYVRIVPVFVWR